MLNVFTEANFNNEVIEASKTKPVLVDFYATWCGPCQLMHPIVESLANEIGEKASIGKINSEEEGNLCEQFGIMSLPTFMIFRDGKPVETLNGVQSKENLKNTLEKHS